MATAWTFTSGVRLRKGRILEGLCSCVLQSPFPEDTQDIIELRSPEQLKKATERARADHLFVQTTTIYRQYRVTNRETGAEYVVNFFVREGRRYGHCNCKAGTYNIACKHLSASAGLHVMIAAGRAESPSSPEWWAA